MLTELIDVVIVKVSRLLNSTLNDYRLISHSWPLLRSTRPVLLLTRPSNWQ